MEDVFLLLRCLSGIPYSEIPIRSYSALSRVVREMPCIPSQEFVLDRENERIYIQMELEALISTLLRCDLCHGDLLHFRYEEDAGFCNRWNTRAWKRMEDGLDVLADGTKPFPICVEIMADGINQASKRFKLFKVSATLSNWDHRFRRRRGCLIPIGFGSNIRDNDLYLVLERIVDSFVALQKRGPRLIQVGSVIVPVVFRLFAFVGDSPISTRAAGSLAPNALLPCHKCWVELKDVLLPTPVAPPRKAEEKKGMYEFIGKGNTEKDRRQRCTSYGLKETASPLSRISVVEEIVEIDPFHCICLNVCKRHLELGYSLMKSCDKETIRESLRRIRLPSNIDKIPLPQTSAQKCFGGFRGVDYLHMTEMMTLVLLDVIRENDNRKYSDVYNLRRECFLIYLRMNERLCETVAAIYRHNSTQEDAARGVQSWRNYLTDLAEIKEKCERYGFDKVSISATVQLHYPFHLLQHIPERGVPLNYTTQFSEEDNVTSTDQLARIFPGLSTLDALRAYVVRMGRLFMMSSTSSADGEEFAEYVSYTSNGRKVGLSNASGTYVPLPEESTEITRALGERGLGILEDPILKRFESVEYNGSTYRVGDDVIVSIGSSEGWVAKIRALTSTSMDEQVTQLHVSDLVCQKGNGSYLILAPLRSWL